jgi:hypothetical protein
MKEVAYHTSGVCTQRGNGDAGEKREDPKKAEEIQAEDLCTYWSTSFSCHFMC